MTRFSNLRRLVTMKPGTGTPNQPLDRTAGMSRRDVMRCARFARVGSAARRSAGW